MTRSFPVSQNFRIDQTRRWVHVMEVLERRGGVHGWLVGGTAALIYSRLSECSRWGDSRCRYSYSTCLVNERWVIIWPGALVDEINLIVSRGEYNQRMSLQLSWPIHSLNSFKDREQQLNRGRKIAPPRELLNSGLNQIEAYRFVVVLFSKKSICANYLNRTH